MVGIVILNYNNVPDTLACIGSVRQFCRPGSYRICVVDNASSREVSEAVGKALTAPDIQIINPENAGYARGNNAALRYFDAVPEVDHILILNNDVLLTEDIVSPMEGYLRSHPSCALVTPLVKAPDGSIDHSCARRKKTPRDLFFHSTVLHRFRHGAGEFMLKDNPSLLSLEEVGIEVPSGSCFMMAKKVFSEVGFFDPATFLYFEEDILAERLRRKGYGAVLLPSVSVIHKGAATTSSRPSAFIYGCYRRSMLYYLDNYTDASGILRAFLRFRTALGAFSKKVREVLNPRTKLNA